MHTEQTRQGESIDIRVNGGRVIAKCRKSGGEVRRDRGLADPAFAGGDGEDSGFDSGLAERVLFTFGLEISNKVSQLIAAHRTDLYMGQQACTRIGAHCAVDLVGNGFAQRTARNGQFDMHGDVIGISVNVGISRRGLDGGNHAEVGDRTAKLRVDDLAQAFIDLGFDLTCVAHKSVSSLRTCTTLACVAAACQREWSKSHWGRTALRIHSLARNGYSPQSSDATAHPQL